MRIPRQKYKYCSLACLICQTIMKVIPTSLFHLYFSIAVSEHEHYDQELQVGSFLCMLVEYTNVF